MAERLRVLIIGAGPAGLAAAQAASEGGATVTLVDALPEPGGQIGRGRWRAEPGAADFKVLREGRATFLGSTRVLAALSGALGVLGPEGSARLPYDRLVLATGARERFLPFPGWTLPGVLGAGGLQAMVKGGLDVRGRRVVVAGTGPLLLAVADHLRRRGAAVLAVAEQAPRAALAPLLPHLLRHPARLTQAWGFRGLPLRFGSWIVRAEASERGLRLHLHTPRRLERLDADLLATGFGLLPTLDLAQVLGCVLEGGRVRVAEDLRTSVAGVFAAGESTGVGGEEKARAEGRLAGLAAVGRAAEPALRRTVQAGRAWAEALERAYALRPELRDLPEADTLLCRCEGRTFADLQGFVRGRDARLQARCGMGLCQGRTCGPMTEFLFGWAPGGPRLPLVPATFAECLGVLSDPENP